MNNKKKYSAHYLISMPDGSLMGIYLSENENIKTVAKILRKNWIKVTSKKMSDYNIENTNEKCPVCGKPLYKSKGSEYPKWCAHCYFEINI